MHSLIALVIYYVSSSTSWNAEEDVQQPGSPSVKKSQEEGIVVVHEVKCKLYVKVSL